MATFTVTRKTRPKSGALDAKYTLTIDVLPGKTFGPRTFREMSDELYVAALISRVEARNLIFDAWLNGAASITGG